MNNTRQIFLLFLLLVLYFFLFPLKLPKELVPVWKSSNLRPITQGGHEVDFVPVDFPSPSGYADIENGDFIPLPDSPEKGIASSAYVIGEKDIFDVYSSKGRYLFTVDDGFIPFFRNERLFAISPDRISLEEWSLEGKRIWRKDFGSVITTMDSSSDYLMLGSLNGNIAGIDNEGNRYFTYQFYTSLHNVVFSISRSAKDQLAVVSGWPEQTLSLFEVKGKSGIYQLKKTIEIESPGVESFRMFYGNDNKDLLLSRSAGNFLYRRDEMLKLEGSYQFSEAGFSSYGIYGMAENRFWNLYSRDGLSSFSFYSRIPFFYTKKGTDHLFIYKNNLLVMSLEKSDE